MYFCIPLARTPCIHYFLPMLRHYYFSLLFSYYRVRFVIYLYATFISVENILRCVRKVTFCRYIIQPLTKYSHSVPVRSLNCSKRQTFSRHILHFVSSLKALDIPTSFLQQACVQWHEHSVRVGLNLFLRVSEYAWRLSGFIVNFRNSY